MAERTFKLTFIGDASRAVGSMNQVEGKMGRMGAATKVAGAAAAAGLAAMGVAAFNTAKQFDEAMNTIRVGTGATDEVLAGLNDTYEKLLTTVPISIENAASVIADLNTRTGATDETLGDMAETFVNLAKLGNTDVLPLIEAGTRLMGDWGIANEDASESMDKVFRAGQTTGASVQGLMQQMVQFGAPMRLFGFTFEETLAILGKFEKEGVNVELVMGSMRIALGKLSKEGVPLKEGLAGLFDEIKNLPQEQAIVKAGELFGTRAGGDMAAAIREGRFELDELVGLIESGDSINALAEEARTLGERFELMSNKVKVALRPALTVVFEVIEKVVDVMSKMNPKVLAGIAIFVALAAALAVVATIVLPLIALIGAISATVGLVIAAIAAAIAIGVLLWQNWDKLGAAAQKVGGWIRDGIGAAIDWVVGKIQALLDKIAALVGAVTNLPGAVGDAVGSITSAIPGSGSGAANALGGGLRRGGGFLGGLLGHDLGGVVGGGRGQPQLIMAHGGETILPTHRQGGGGQTVNIVINGSVIATQHELQRLVTRAINNARAVGADF